MLKITCFSTRNRNH